MSVFIKFFSSSLLISNHGADNCRKINLIEVSVIYYTAISLCAGTKYNYLVQDIIYFRTILIYEKNHDCVSIAYNNNVP